MSHKRERDGYSGYTDVVLRRELKKRKYRVNGRNREEMILLLEEDDKTQSVIRWATPQLEHQGQANLLREGEGEEGGEGDATPNHRDEREDLWEDVDPPNQGANGMGAEERDSPRPLMRRNLPLKTTGMQGGRGHRGYWARRRDDQLKKSLKSGEKDD